MRILLVILLAVTACLTYANPFMNGAILNNYAELTGYAGSGADGAITVQGPTNGPNNPFFTDNTRTYLTAAATGGSTSVLTVASATGFAAGNVVLIISMLGSTAGTYEFRNVSAASGTSITLSASVTNSYPTYSAGAAVTQVIKVPQYTTVTFNSGGFMSARPFDGQTGGVVAFLASGNVSIGYNATYSGRIDVTGRGHLLGSAGAAGGGPGGGAVGQGGSNTSPGSSPIRLIMGSGGGGNTGTGASGGGLVFFKTGGTLTIDGMILANGGAAPASSNGGGGAGGTIAISADTMTKTSTCGTVTATGGAGNGTGTAGGSGRIFMGFKTSNGCNNATPNASYPKYIVK